MARRPHADHVAAQEVAMFDTLMHPKLVHVPMALGILMPLVATGLLLAWWRNWLTRRGWFVAIGLQAILFASGILAMRTGEVDEERVEQRVDEAYIHQHEEAAETFVWASGGVLAVMILAAALGSRRRAGLSIAAVSTLGTIAVLGLGYRTGQAGGSLVYEHGAAQALSERAPPRTHDHDAAPAHPPATGIAIPPSLKHEHEALHADLAHATKAGGRTGEAARGVAELMHPHFVKEDTYALPPLGLLATLADGAPTNTRDVLALTDTLKADLRTMLDEHAAIVTALETLTTAATAENKPDVAAFARRLIHHAVLEQEVMYPAAILVGEYLRLRVPPPAG